MTESSRESWRQSTLTSADAAKRYDATVGGKTDYVAGANIAGFEKVVDAMLSSGCLLINSYSK